MSSYSRITDEEMKYFQFKAKQHLLIQKEDHEWNEFCKLKKCTCCSCQPHNITQPNKDVGIQVSQKKSICLLKSADNKSVQNKDLPELHDMKTMLEKIDISLSEIKRTPLINVGLNETISLENKSVENDYILNLLAEQKKNLIKKSLMKSLQRLHSLVDNRSLQATSSSFIKSSNRSFFLPHDLQEQRVRARNAYLVSLTDKPKLDKGTCLLKAKKNKVSFESKDNPKITTSKPRRKRSVQSIEPKAIIEPTEQETLIQSESTSDIKDENVENIVNDIVDDLLGDEILAFSRIKQKKAEIQLSKAKQVDVQGDQRKKEVSLSKALCEARAYIKQNPFFNLKEEKTDTFIKVPSNDVELFEDMKKHIESNNKVDTFENGPNEASVNTQEFSLYNKKSEMKHQVISKNCHTLTVDPVLVKNVVRQRKLYWQYLNRISRTKTFNFDPCAISNMISESLLDDCIIDVCKELGEVPTSLITDLVNQEFLSTL